MPDYLLRFTHPQSLFGFFYSAELQADEILQTQPKRVDGQYWLVTHHLPERLRQPEEDQIRRLIAIYPDAGHYEKLTPLLLSQYDHCKEIYSLANLVFLFPPDGKENGEMAISENEFIVAVVDKRALQKLAAFFLGLNHVAIKVLALAKDEALPFEYLLWINGFKSGVPVQLTARSALEEKQWEVFYNLEDAPAQQRWFADRHFKGPKPSAVPGFNLMRLRSPQEQQFQPSSESVLIIFQKLVFGFDAKTFSPILDHVRLEIGDVPPPDFRPKYIGKDDIEFKLVLERRPANEVDIQERLRRLDKKHRELSDELKRLSRLKAKLGEYGKELGSDAYLYCYKADDKNFRRIIQERPLSEKEGLCYYKSSILGYGSDEFHILTSRRLFHSGWAPVYQWNITQEFLPGDSRHQYYLHPEWYFAGVWIFTPLEYAVVPHIDLTHTEHATTLVRTLLPKTWNQKQHQDFKRDDYVTALINNNIFILTPKGQGGPGSAILTTIIARESFIPLLEAFNYINETVNENDLKQYAHQTSAVAFKVFNYEVDLQVSQKLKWVEDDIRGKEQEVICEDRYYQWELSQLKQAISQKLENGTQVQTAANNALQEYQALRRLCNDFLQAFKQLAFPALNGNLNDFIAHLDVLQKFIKDLQAIIGDASAHQRELETALQAKLDEFAADTDKMSKDLNELARSLQNF